MTKRIMAVGNGSELLEATPYGDVIRWTWDARTKTYNPIVEDASSTYGKRLRKTAVVIEPVKPVIPDSSGVVSLPEDDVIGAGW